MEQTRREIREVQRKAGITRSELGTPRRKSIKIVPVVEPPAPKCICNYEQAVKYHEMVKQLRKLGDAKLADLLEEQAYKQFPGVYTK